MADNAPNKTREHESPFSIKVERRGDVAVVVLYGSSTMDVSGELGACMREVASDQTRLIVVDMSRVDFMESTSLGGIVAGYLRMRRHEGEVRLAAPTPVIRHLLELTRLNQLLPVFETVEAALC